MKKILSILLASAILLALNISFVNAANSNTSSPSDKNQKLLKGVSHMKNSTIRIQGEKVIYIDPLGIDGEPKDADLVFVTHTHGDHFSVQDIKKVIKKDATLIITADGVSDAKKAGFSKIVTVAPSKSYTVDGIKFKTTPAYNIGKDFHPKSNNWVGYIISINNAIYYMAGDTDVIPEMKNIKADVAFLPVGGTYTMTAQEAANAANMIKPKVAVPIHFADVVGTTDDAAQFVKLLNKGIQGVVLKDLLKGVQHFKQSTIKISADKTIYFDPYLMDSEMKDADIIFITHNHPDHFSIADIKKVMKSSTVLVVTQDDVAALTQAGIKNVQVVSPSKSYEVDGIKFKTVPAYNTNKSFHPKSNNWVGYIVTVNNTTYYRAGDTDVIPEMNGIKANVVFLPVGGTYTMTASEAAQAANIIKPLVAVPIHYGAVVGSVKDANSFVQLLDKSIKGVVL